MKSPLHTHWVLHSTLHFKNLRSFRGNKDLGFFFPLRCDEHLLSLQDALKHLENSHVAFDTAHSEARGMWFAHPGLKHKEVLSNTGSWAHPPGIPLLAHPALQGRWEWLGLRRRREYLAKISKCLYSSPPYLPFCFSSFQLPAVNHGPKILNGKVHK